MENKDKKEITLNELATVVKNGFEASDKRTDAKIDKLAAAVKAGFEASDKRTDAKIDKLAEMVGKGFNEMGERMDGMQQDVNSLKQGQERIEMRLNNVVYRSEMDAVLDRVQVLEKQMKIALKK